MPSTNPTLQVTVRLDRNTLARLDTLATRHGYSRAHQIRVILHDWLDATTSTQGRGLPGRETELTELTEFRDSTK